MTKLFDYQKDGVKQIEKFDGRVLLADEMGLGKTIQALYYHKRNKKGTTGSFFINQITNEFYRLFKCLITRDLSLFAEFL